MIECMGGELGFVEMLVLIVLCGVEGVVVDISTR